MNLTGKLVGVQSDLEDARNTLITLNKQVELKELDIERLKLQVNTNKTFERESEELKKALEAKEIQLENYRVQMDEIELSLSQAENKYDHYVENCKKLKEENEKLSEEMGKKIKEQQQNIIATRKELELKYDQEVNKLKDNQEQQITQLKQSHAEETKNLKEKIDMLRKSSASKSDTTAVSTPASRDSPAKRHSSVTTEYSQVSLWKSSIRSSTDPKGSATSRLDTALSQTSVNKEKDSVLETSDTLSLSMSNTVTPQATPKLLEEQRQSFVSSSRDTCSTANDTTETSTQAQDLTRGHKEKSRNDLQQIGRDFPQSDHLSQKMEEYKNKFIQVQQQFEEEVAQWKTKFNAKVQDLSQICLLYDKEVQEKERLMEQLSAAKEQQTQAEREAEEAILELEELRAVKEGSIDVIQDVRPSVATKSALLTRDKVEVQLQDRSQSPGGSFLQESVAVQCPSVCSVHQPDIVSPQYSESRLSMTDGVIGIPATDSGFEESGYPSRLPDEVCETNEAMAFQNTVVESKESIEPPPTPVSFIKSPTPVSFINSPTPSSRAVRSRLVRSALKDHRVVMEIIKTYEMVAEFKMNITCWLKQYGLENTSELMAIPDVALDKTDELDVLSKLPLIRDQTQQILGALWQVSRDNYCWHEDGAVEFDDDNCDDHEETHFLEYPPTSSSSTKVPAAPSEKRNVNSADGRSLVIDKHLRARSKILSRASRTTPRGYTKLLHDYNDLNEAYSKLQERLGNDVESYKQQARQNAAIMDEMQETINNLRWQLLETSYNGGNMTQPLVSSVMFTRLDAERNVKSMKRAVQSKRLSQTLVGNAVQQMNQYINLPARRLVELVKRYTHHCGMREVEENLSLSSVTSEDVYNLQERMEHLQRVRAGKWSDKMAEISQKRSLLGDEITSTLNKIEESSGIFLIKPVYSYSSRPQGVYKSSHPIICKKRSSSKPSASVIVDSKKSSYPLESANVAVFSLKESSDGPMWISKESRVHGPARSYENISIPRLLAMDVNRIMLNRNPVSDYITPKTSASPLVCGVRQYVTVERPIGLMSTSQHDRHSDAVSPCHSCPVDDRSSSPSLTHYSALPPINLPDTTNQPQYCSAMSAYTNQSASSLSITSSDET